MFALLRRVVKMDSELENLNESTTPVFARVSLHGGFLDRRGDGLRISTLSAAPFTRLRRPIDSARIRCRCLHRSSDWRPLSPHDVWIGHRDRDFGGIRGELWVLCWSLSTFNAITAYHSADGPTRAMIRRPFRRVGAGGASLTRPTAIPSGWRRWPDNAPHSARASPAKRGDIRCRRLWSELRRRNTPPT